MACAPSSSPGQARSQGRPKAPRSGRRRRSGTSATTRQTSSSSGRWPEICAEETTYDAAFAAVPYLIDFAARLGTAEADQYLIVAGLIATSASDVPSDLEPAFRTAMHRGLTLALERLKNCKTNADLRYLLASVAAMRGRTDLAAVLQNLDAIQEPCTTCGTVVYPSELQAAIERDRSS